MILLLPTVAVEAGGRAAWMVAMAAGVSGFLSLLLVGKLGQRFPGLTLVGYAERLLGKWAGRIIGLGAAVNFALNASVDVGVAMKNLEGIYFTKTPPMVIGIILAVMALSVVWFGLVTASRMAPLLLATLGITFLLTFPLLWRWVKPGYLIPLFDASPVAPGSKPFWVAAGAVRASLFPVVYMAYIKETGKAVRTLAWAHWTGMVGNLLAVLAPILVFSPEGARALPQPFPFVIGIIRLPNFPLERVEMLARLAFHINTIYAVANIYFTAGLLMAEVFGTKTIRPFMVIAAVLSLLPQLFLPSSARGTEFAYDSVLRGLVVTWTLFPLLWLVYWLRGMGRRTPTPTQNGSHRAPPG